MSFHKVPVLIGFLILLPAAVSAIDFVNYEDGYSIEYNGYSGGYTLQSGGQYGDSFFSIEPCAALNSENGMNFVVDNHNQEVYGFSSACLFKSETANYISFAYKVNSLSEGNGDTYFEIHSEPNWWYDLWVPSEQFEIGQWIEVKNLPINSEDNAMCFYIQAKDATLQFYISDVVYSDEEI